jgi:hypothetical protein
METTVQHHISVSNVYKTASLTALGLISYFLVMKLLHLNTVVELRFINFLIVMYGVRQVLLHKRMENNGKLEYLPGMMIAFMTAFISSAMFAAFIFIYLNIDSSFMAYLVMTQPFGNDLTPAGCALVTFLEGVFIRSHHRFCIDAPDEPRQPSRLVRLRSLTAQ